MAILPLEPSDLYSSKPFQAAHAREDLQLWLDHKFRVGGNPSEVISANGRLVGHLLLAAWDACDLCDVEFSAYRDHEQRFVNRLLTICAEADRLIKSDREDYSERIRLTRLRERCAITAWCYDGTDASIPWMVAECYNFRTQEAALLAVGARLQLRFVSGERRAAAIRAARQHLGIERLQQRLEGGQGVGPAKAKKNAKGPGLVVLRSVDHLPAARAGDRQHAHSEFQGMAGRKLALREAPDLAAARDELVAEAPHHASVIDLVLGDVARARDGIAFRPTLFIDEPGSGKSRLARRIGEVLGLDVSVIGCGGQTDGSFAGTSRQWGTARASVPLQAIRRSDSANPLILLDELDKAGTGDHNGRLSDALVGMLEPETARVFFDPYVECPVDLSRVLWLATANSKSRLPGPLLDRFRIVHLPRPGMADAPAVVRSILADLRRDRREDEVWLPDLAPDELDLVLKQWRGGGGSVRLLRRLVETVVDGREAMQPRH